MARAPFPRLPASLTLPSGAVVQLRREEGVRAEPLAPREGSPLFEETRVALAEGRARVTQNGATVEATSLPLRDFHVLRAVLARSGITEDGEIEITCRNCGEPIQVRPCASLEIGPWVDGELGDPELDATAPLGEPIPVPPIPLGGARTARTVTFEERTVAQATPLFAAATAEHLEVDAALVRALGIVSLDGERDPARIAEALAACDDAAFAAVGSAFLATHYVPRLAGVVFCASCGARNDVDAPYERELVPDRPSASALPGASTSASPRVFPDYEAFAARASQLAEAMLARLPGEPVELVIEGETPAVDDGGEPLLGSYVPPHPGDTSTPSRAPVVAIYYRTFRAVWDEEGPYDWEGELLETLEHELEHHVYFLRGEDPMDEEERALIRDEAMRIVGRREAGRRELAGFGASLRDFGARTWPLWVIALLALALMLATQR